MNDLVGMGAAIEQAQAALGRTAPNPSVGAVLVRGDQILGRGRTQPVGGPHAEVEALRDAEAAGFDVRGATLYVTLEPCCHWGRTPPCTDAIVRAGIARVVVGVVDPYPPMLGKGLGRLRAAGVEVELGVEAEACARLVLGFTRTVTRGLPEVTAKVAMSLDGNLATAQGESRWITGEEARADVHRMRATHDAILVGVRTVLADDPRLTARVEGGKDPVPVILDPDLRTPLNAKIWTSGRAPVVVCALDAPARAIPGEVLRVARGPAGLDLEAALRAVASLGLHRVFVEGGSKVHRSFLDQGWVDTLHVYLAPVLIPGGRPWLGGEPLGALGHALRLPAPTEIKTFGADTRLTWRLVHRVDALAEPSSTT